MFQKLNAAAAVLSLAATGALAGDLVIVFDDLTLGPKKSFEGAIAQVQAEDPDINVIVNNDDREAHKVAIRNFLSAHAPDVTSWYRGKRMASFVDAGLFDPVDDVWEADGFNQDLVAIKATLSRDGTIWGGPLGADWPLHDPLPFGPQQYGV